MTTGRLYYEPIQWTNTDGMFCLLASLWDVKSHMRLIRWGAVLAIVAAELRHECSECIIY